MRALRTSAFVVALVAVTAVVVGGAARAEDDDLSILGNKRTVVAAFVQLKKDQAGTKDKVGRSQTECTATSGGAANTNLDCDDPFPNNEPNIVVDPASPMHMVASSNDYGSCCDQYYTTFDGGATWTTGNMSTETPTPLGPIGSDPVTTFDTKHNMTLHSSLNFYSNPSFTETCNGDVVVSPSSDGGATWDKPAVVDKGVGCDLSRLQLFNDKEWITTDNNPGSKFFGRTYVTWTKFESHAGGFFRSAIFESHSDDGGKHWTGAQEISGANANLCTEQVSGPAGQCDEDQFSVPTVGPDGTVYVAFENSQNDALNEQGEVGDSQYLLVKSTNGGATWANPTFVVGLEDGSNDYPLNVDGRQTLTGYQTRVNSAGNIVAGPSGSLFLTFSDNRNGIHDVANPVTNIDVFVVSSTNGGGTWSVPSLVDSGHGDQWFPWVDVNPVTGKIGVAYNDRGNSNGTPYNATIAEGMPGSFVRTKVSTASSDPVHSEFFKAGADAPTCDECARFNGDYIGLAYGSDGHANAIWTDMRDVTPDGHAEFIYFARK